MSSLALQVKHPFRSCELLECVAYITFQQRAISSRKTTYSLKTRTSALQNSVIMASGIPPGVHPPAGMHGGWPVDRVPFSHSSNYHYTPNDLAAVSNDIHSWEAGGRNAPNVQREFEDFYGLNLYQKADQRPKPQEKYDLPETFYGLTGANGIVSRAIIKLITIEQQWPVREVLPWKQHEGSLAVGWDEFHFNDHSLTETPHEVPPRLLTSEKIGHQEAMKRFGLAMLLEHDFMKTPEGRLQYKMNMQQIANAVLNTCIHGAMIALVTSKYNPKNLAMTMYNQKFTMRDFKEFLSTQKEFFGVLQKNELGAAAIVDLARDVLAQRNNFDADTLIVPEGAAKFCAFTHASGGLDGSNAKVDPGRSILANTSDARGFKVFESSKIATGDGSGPHDPLYRPRSHGEHYLMTDRFLLSVPDSQYRTSMMTIKVFDEDRDAIVQISPFTVWEAARPPAHDRNVRPFLKFDPSAPSHSMEEKMLLALGGTKNYFHRNLYDLILHMNGSPWLREWIKHISLRILQGIGDADVPTQLIRALAPGTGDDNKGGQPSDDNNGSGPPPSSGPAPNMAIPGDSSSGQALFHQTTGTATANLFEAPVDATVTDADTKVAERDRGQLRIWCFVVEAPMDEINEIHLQCSNYVATADESAPFVFLTQNPNDLTRTLMVVGTRKLHNNHGIRGDEVAANGLFHVPRERIAGSEEQVGMMLEGLLNEAKLAGDVKFEARLWPGQSRILNFTDNGSTSKDILIEWIHRKVGELARRSAKRSRPDDDDDDDGSSVPPKKGSRGGNKSANLQAVIKRRLKKLSPYDLFDLIDICMHENARPPVAFLILQPHITHLMGSAIVCKRGSTLGNTMWGHVDFQLADNVALKMHYGNFTMYTKPLVFEPSKLVVIPDVFSRKYMGGGGTRFYRVDNEDDLYLYKDSVTGGGKDMFACIVPATFEPEEDLDITGAFANVEAQFEEHYPTALVYAQHWGWTRAPNDVANLSFVDFGNCPRNYNSVVSKGFQVSLCNDGNTPLFMPGHGCWGNRVYDGCGSVRKGYAGVLRPVDYNNTQTFMVEKVSGYGMGV